LTNGILNYAEASDRLVGRVQRIRVDAQELLAQLDKVDTAGRTKDAKARARQVKQVVHDADELVKGKSLNEHITELEEILAANDKLARRQTGAAWRIHNALQQIQRGHWPGSRDPADALAESAAARPYLDTVVASAAEITVPPTLRDRLDQIAVGKPLDFHTTFKSELPKQAEREELLAALAAEEHDFRGIVDTGRGLVYKVSRSRTWRVLSYLSPLICAVLAGAFLVLVGNLDNLGVALSDSWHLNDVGALISAYVLVLAGTVIHLLVENVKQLQSRSVPILAIGDGLDWLHLHWAGLALTYVWVLVTVIGLRVINIGTTDSELPIYLFAGYSVDSIAGLFLTRFDSSARGGLKGLTQTIQGGSAGSSSSTDYGQAS
jgi:hypothetical protein